MFIMLRSNFFGSVFILIVIIGGLHYIADVFNLYWEVWWFDLMMHFLGGFWIALSTLWLIYFSPFFEGKSKSFKVFLLSGIVGAMLIGILWEIFEYATDSTYTAHNYILDTSTDLVADFIGGVVAVLYVYYRSLKKNLIHD